MRELGWAMLLGLAACTPGTATPTLTGMDPDWGFQGEDTDVNILGTDLFPAVSVGGGGALDWDRGFRAWLDGPQQIDLSGVAALDYGELSATVPGGLELGLYDLVVETPTGDQITLPNAWRATDSRADRIQVTVDSSQVDIGQYAEVRVTVLDPGDDLVQTPLPVEVSLVTDDVAQLSFADDPALDGQTVDEETGLMTGALSADGVGSFAISADDQAQVSVWVSASETGSVVDSDMVLITFQPGPVASVEIELPDDLDDLRAGDTMDVSLRLLDDAGHPTSGTQAVLYLRESCPGGDLGDTVYVLDELEDLPVTITAATNLDCAEDSLVVSGVADGTTFEGESEGFQVAPGPAEHLDLLATPGEVQVGHDPLTVWVWVEDAWDNVVDDYTASLSLEDSAGGLDPGADVGVQSCEPFSTGPALTFCEVQLWRTGDAVTITGRDTSGNTGTSNPIVVTPGDLADIDAEVGTTAIVAGEPLEVAVSARDGEGNALGTDPASYGNLSFKDDRGALECERDRMEGSGAIYVCTLTRADEGDHIQVSLVTPDLEVSDTTEPFTVLNAPLDEVLITLGDVSVVAGADLAVSLAGVDLYGNPYIVGADRDIELTDLTGTMELTGSATTITLDSSGEATTSVSFTRARTDNVITAVQGTDTLGDSEAFDVVPGPLDGFDVQPEATFGWLGEALTVTLAATDAYGNPVPSFNEPAELRSAGGLGDPVTVASWSGGEAEVSFVFRTAGLGDTLDLWVDDVLQESSTTVDALRDDCDSGPTAALTVAGDAPATLCLSGGSTPDTTVSASSSSAGDAALAAWHFELGDGEWERTTDDELTTSWTGEGAWTVRAVVADALGCADEVETAVYVASADGQPAGPVTLTLDDDTLIAGSGAATVTVSAVDCAGDPAEGELMVWVDLGAVTAGSSALVTSGQGMALTVAGGAADLRWSMLDDAYAGNATLRAGTLSGSAYGEAEATVSGETARPLVLEVDPSGSTLSSFDAFSVTFSEPIPSRYLTSGTVSLTTSDGPLVLGDPTMSDDDTVATFPLLAAEIPGVYTLTLSTDVRDRAGNRLNGEWRADGAASDFSLTFGDVVDSAPGMSACDLATASTFRPDGDPTTTVSSEEIDSVTLNAVADAVPSWWALRVYDEAGALVRTLRVVPEDSRDPLSWDGRDQSGFIVDNGEYTVTVTAEDSYWNAGTSCSTTVTVDNHVVGLP